MAKIYTTTYTYLLYYISMHWNVFVVRTSRIVYIMLLMMSIIHICMWKGRLHAMYVVHIIYKCICKSMLFTILNARKNRKETFHNNKLYKMAANNFRQTTYIYRSYLNQSYCQTSGWNCFSDGFYFRCTFQQCT